MEFTGKMKAKRRRRIPKKLSISILRALRIVLTILLGNWTIQPFFKNAATGRAGEVTTEAASRTWAWLFRAAADVQRQHASHRVGEWYWNQAGLTAAGGTRSEFNCSLSYSAARAYIAMPLGAGQ